ncbi:hypothetical protein LAZ67_2005433 [Cordylochernes scorpioides]|uniref:Integrase catalytic domain-containing protein n=1 Tax=Cordylochernes scorpioides TaxID=51811 RepID=A0ABY6K4J4_9ARAC|nr:hypothetical protein LAZ67_2005433 [Cordylochernes scorpioides]
MTGDLYVLNQTKENLHTLKLNLDSQVLKLAKYKSLDIADKFKITYNAVKITDGMLVSINRFINGIKQDKSTSEEFSIKLPKFQLPIFSGNFSEWLGFKEIFIKVIDQNRALANSQKLQYLVSALRGDAARLVRAFSISDENYSIAWKTLIYRYDNKRELAFRQIYNFFNLGFIKGDSNKALYEFLDICNEGVQNLSSLGLERNILVGSILIYIIQSKLDNSLKKDWELHIDVQVYPSYDELMAFLEKYARSLADLRLRETSRTSPKPNKKVYSHATSVSRPNSNAACTPCMLCKNSHLLSKYNQLRKFWELDSIPPCTQPILTKEEIDCEQHFKTNVLRTTTGRHQVRLSFRVTPNFRNSKIVAFRRFLSLENKLLKSERPYSRYKLFYDLRVVFDASACSDDSPSLKKALHIGPKLKTDIFDLLLRFRTFFVALSADIEKISLLFLDEGGFPIRKWVSNSPKILDFLPKDQKGIKQIFDFKDLPSVKLLGILWDPSLESFTIRVKPPDIQVYSKRSLLSLIAGIYDPLGWMAPLVIIFKIMLQKLWTKGCNWDERLPECIQWQWTGIEEDINKLNKISIPSFSVSKFFVAVKESLSLHFDQIFLWSDSTIALNWIKSESKRWKTFVANRVSAIQRKTPPHSWFHVPGSENPADLATRGLIPAQLVDNQLWWQGPHWLQDPSVNSYIDLPPSDELSPETLIEERSIILVYQSIHRSKVLTQIMGELPLERVVPSRHFQRVRVDLAGPIITKPMLKRSKILFKTYIVLFICFTTKAIHLEVVSDLTAEAFIATLRRFTSRRGLPSDIFSDNATNFKLTNRVLLDFYRELNIKNFCAQRGIRWHFIPPSASHFGGLWKAGIKSVKSHLIKVTKAAILNFEEFYTLLTQIEAILNSRPLLPLDSNFDSYEALTPSHFFIGSPLLAIPDEVVDNLSHISRCKCIQSMKNSFWKKWSQDYLNLLQSRPRWHKTHQDLQSGQLVLMKQDSTHPHHWPLARIIKTYKGPDGHVRVVDLKTSKNVFKRPITKIAPLPFKEWILFLLDLAVQRGGNRVEVAKKMLEIVEKNPNWKEKVITGDETLVYGYDPETKRQSMEWKGKDEPRTKKSRLCKSKNKVLLVTFFDIKGIFLIMQIWTLLTTMMQISIKWLT